jgi:BirA family biotin operon repressor/biotin-[acetyl-CoA-carboxylase] ligase
MASSARAKYPVVLRHLATVDSTNTWAKLHAPSFDAAAVTVVTADEQTAGRGRSGRLWKSTPGADIKATFAFRLPAGALATAYQLSPFLAVVAARALRAAGVSTQIKWPNDLILAGCKKFAGILCELESVGGDYWAALGVGINVNSLPEELGVERPVWPLTTLRAETGREWDVKALQDGLIHTFAEARGGVARVLRRK